MNESQASLRWRQTVALPLRLGLAVLFVVAGVMKLRDPTRFALEISNYQLIHSGTALLAAILPAIEIVAALGLLVLPHAWRQASALLITTMVMMFTVAVGFAYFQGINIDCGCFGGAEGPITGWTLARNVGLLVAGALVFLLEPRDNVSGGGRLRIRNF